MFWTGYTSAKDVIAFSLNFATKKLSTMLYIAFTAIEITIGSDIDNTKGKIFFSFIKL